jgi:two-component system chemotaxis response regulator CheB
MQAWAENLGARSFEAVVIGASAGGVDALLALLPGLPPDLPVPIVVVLHIPPDRESRLADLFEPRVGCRTGEARDKEPLEAGMLYFAGPGYHLSIERDRTFSLSLEEPVQFARPSIDVLMESAADAYGPALAAIVLTGANHDGAAGLAAVRRAGGLAVVQDPAEAQVPTMPAAALAQARPDLVLKLGQIHELLLLLERS